MTEELIHVRCITCNKVIADKWIQYKDLLSEGKSIKEALNTVGLTRPCCRMRMMNPFKVVTRVDSQIDSTSQEKLMEGSFAKLSVATKKEGPSKGALSAMQDITEFTIVPEESSDISLPGLPDLPLLPDFPVIGEEKEKKVKREYDAR